MPRPRNDGQPPAPPCKRRLTFAFVKSVPRPPMRRLYWDEATPGLALVAQPSGKRSWRYTYRAAGRLRVFTLGPADAIPLAEARQRARVLAGQVASGGDPQGDKRRERHSDRFEDLARVYFQHVQGRNKAWRQFDAIARRYLLPRWGKLRAHALTRADVRAVMREITDAGTPVLANLVLAVASAIFSFAVREEVGGITANPCHGVTRNPTRSRERVLSDAELPLFWRAWEGIDPVRGAALKVLLLTGQRPGEVAHMRREHIRDGWWEMPGEAAPQVGWPGTKNSMSHRVWLSEPVRDLLAGLEDGQGADTGFVFAADARGQRPVSGLDEAMRRICQGLGLEPKVTPHDLRRTHGTCVTALGYGREAMNRIQNHREGGIATVYDRHGYAAENQQIQEAVAKRLMALACGDGGDNVVALPQRRAG